MSDHGESKLRGAPGASQRASIPVKEYLAERAELLAWAREEATTFCQAHSLTVSETMVELLAVKLAASYLVGANAALLDETRRTQARSRPAQFPAADAGGIAPEGGAGTRPNRGGC